MQHFCAHWRRSAVQHCSTVQYCREGQGLPGGPRGTKNGADVQFTPTRADPSKALEVSPVNYRAGVCMGIVVLVGARWIGGSLNKSGPLRWRAGGLG